MDRSIELFLGDDEPIRNLGEDVVKAFVFLFVLLTVFHVRRLHGQCALCATCHQTTTTIIIKLSIAAEPDEVGRWLDESSTRGWIVFAFNLIPFAGIFFLWGAVT